MRKSNNYWTKERCKEESLKYESRNEFKKIMLVLFLPLMLDINV